MNIEIWLNNFKKYWESHSVDDILSLFDEDVIYFETPFIKLNNFYELTKEWEVIENQKNIKLEYEVFSSCEDKHSIIWKLKYEDKDGILRNLSGTYLIKLNKQGLCDYFHHTCESEK